VLVASSAFAGAAERQAALLGQPALARVFVAHPVQDRTDEEMRALADAARDLPIRVRSYGEAAGAGPPRDGAEQARLADACLTRDEQQPAFARRGGGEPVLDQGEERVPADQDRRLDAPASPHDAPPPT